MLLWSPSEGKAYLESRAVWTTYYIRFRRRMSLDLEEANETRQLMQNDGEVEEQKAPQSATSPVTSNKLSSGPTSLSSKAPQVFTSTGNNSLHDSSKYSYVNERRLHRDLMRSGYNSNKPKVPKEAPDVKEMEKSLLKLLDDFNTGKLSAFGSGCTMEQMINIRDQQEHLAKLHFRLYGDEELLSDNNFDTFDNITSKDKMAQLVQSLEQLSTSIEHLHSDGTPDTVPSFDETSKNKEPH